MRNLGIAAAVSLAFGITGSVLTGLYCQNYAAVADCRHGCNDGTIKNPTNLNCYTYCEKAYYGIRTPEHPVCITGSLFVAEDLLSGVLLLGSYPITVGWNYFADWRNEAWSAKIREEFKKGRADDEPMVDRDFSTLGIGAKLIKDKSALLKKLSPAQALTMAELNFQTFFQLDEELFSPSAWEKIDDLRKMLEMGAHELSETLGKASKLFVEEPTLWQALVRLLPEQILNNSDVQKGLKYVIKIILNEEKEKEYDEVIYQVAHGIPLRSYLLNELIIADGTNDEDRVELSCGEEKFLLKKDTLKANSDYFARVLSGKFKEPGTDYSNEKPERFRLFVDAIHGRIKLARENLWPVLDVATYYQMPGIIIQCDRFIRDTWKNNRKKLMRDWLADEKVGNLDPDAFATSWAFCKKFSLLETKRFLASELMVRLMEEGEKQIILADLKELFADDLRKILIDTSLEALTNKLTSPRFLKWVWENGQNNALIKNIVVDFCSAEKTKPVMRKAWVIVPEELLQAVAERERAKSDDSD